nr:MAG TPA: hypothetical protein [Caudoviricetes sp.]
MASEPTRAGYGTGAGRVRTWMLITPARNQSVNRHKTSRGEHPGNKKRQERTYVRKNKRWTPAKMLPPL